MILLVPISPEVPKYHIPQLWPGLVLVLILGVAFLQTYDLLERDAKYVQGVVELTQRDAYKDPKLAEFRMQSYLSLRPLLKIAPALGDWDIPRMFLANFVHAGKIHLLLNLVGAFCGARICATFLPFYLTLFIFLFGGTLGIGASTLLSSEDMNYIHHIGASGGIFALMGAYYVFNFRFRTRYFFWFPSKHGKISLKTSWFFFLDVILLELVLSAAQLLPTKVDNVDHLAHVVGFGTGLLLALGIRFIQHWPNFLQTRAELLFWRHRPKKPTFQAPHTPVQLWLDCLEVNPYNDRIKMKLVHVLYKFSPSIGESDLSTAFSYFSPTFVRSHSHEMGVLMKKLLSDNRTIPLTWLQATPYDIVIRVAKAMAIPPEEQHLLYQFIDNYRRALPPDASGFNHKLELLISKLGGLVPPQSASPRRSLKVAEQRRVPRPPYRRRGS